MSNIHTVIGIDPGLVHTGVVRIQFDSTSKTLTVDSAVIDGPDAKAVWHWIYMSTTSPVVFIEKYVPRQRYGTDERMVKAEAAFITQIPHAKVIRNTGAKQVVTQDLMQVLGVWTFNTPTHHQDLRAAARILLYGMMKDKHLNHVLADVIHDELDGHGWTKETA